LVDIIYHMNTRLLFDVDNLVKYNKNGLSKNLKTLDKNNELILDTSDINLIPETIGRIRKNSLRIQPKLESLEPLQSIQNSVNTNNNDILGITIDEIEKNNECDYIFSDSSTTECSPNNLNSNDSNDSV